MDEKIANYGIASKLSCSEITRFSMTLSGVDRVDKARNIKEVDEKME